MYKDRFNFIIKAALTLLYVVCPLCWLLPFLRLSVYGKVFKNGFTSVFNRYVLPPLAVIFVFSFVFSVNDIYPFGDKTIAWCDLTQQGVPYWMNFKSIIEGEDSIFLNMANAAGMDAWSLLRGVFLSPFSYIALFIERYTMMDFVTVLQVLKLAACSATSMVFFKVCLKKLNPSIAVALSVSYSFCAYGGMYYQILLWPDIMYTLPLFAAGIYLLIKKKKIALYAISLAMMMNSFMMGFMIVIATILFFGYYLAINEDKEDCKHIAFNFIVGSIWAALLSAFTWLPFFSAYNSSARSESLSSSLGNIKFFTSKETVFPLVMSTGLIFIGVFSGKSMLKDRFGRSLLFLVGMMSIAMVFEPVNAMWHGGSYMSFPARFAYILIFVGLVICGMVYSYHSEEKTELCYTLSKAKSFLKHLSFSLLLLLTIAFIGNSVLKYTESNISILNNYVRTLWGNEDSYQYQTAVLLMFIVMYGVCYLFYKKKLVPNRIIPIALVVIVLVEAICTINIYFVPARNKVNTESFRNYADLSERIDDNRFFRVKNDSFLKATYSVSEANFPGAIGYNSMGHYSSLASETYLYFAKALGYSSVWMKIESFGGTKFSDALMSVGYSISKNDSYDKMCVYENGQYRINRLEYYLPLGQYTSSADIDVDLEGVTRIGLQEAIFDSYTDNAYDLFAEYTPVPVNCTFVHASEDNDRVYRIEKNGDEKATLEYTVKIEGTKTLYLDCFDKFSNELSEKIYGAFAVYLNGQRVDKAIHNENYYPSSSYNGIFELGTFSDTTVSVSLEVLEDVNCRSFGLYSMDDALLSEHIKDISTSELKVTGNEISGDYTAERDGYLVVAVPYDGAFKCTVNGKAVKVEKAFGGLIAVPVSVGENEISLSFTSPMFYGALILVALGLLLGIVFFVYMKRRSHNSLYDVFADIFGGRTASIAAMVGKVCVLIAFASIILVIYIYPTVLKLSAYWK